VVAASSFSLLQPEVVGRARPPRTYLTYSIRSGNSSELSFFFPELLYGGLNRNANASCPPPLALSSHNSFLSPYAVFLPRALPHRVTLPARII